MSSTNPNSRFISEAAIEESRKERESAWQKAYDSHQRPPPSDASYDTRTLYERLQEQRRLKDDTLAESRRFANQIRKLDPEETEFLETVDDEEREKTETQKRSELAALAAFREEVVESQRERPKRKQSSGPVSAVRGSLLDKIRGVVVRPASAFEKNPESACGVEHGNKKKKLRLGCDGVKDNDDGDDKELNPLGLLASYGSDSDGDSDSDSGSNTGSGSAE